MHALVYVLQNTGDTNREPVEDLTILNDLPYADYTEELPLQEQHFTRLTEFLEKHFGKENLIIDRGKRLATIRRAGIIRYFNWLRARIYNSGKLAMDKPIENFIHLRGETDWYAIKTMIDDPFDTQFYMDGYGCGSMTVFAHNLYVQMGYEQTDALTLKLTQVFDYHY